MIVHRKRIYLAVKKCCGTSWTTALLTPALLPPPQPKIFTSPPPQPPKLLPSLLTHAQVDKSSINSITGHIYNWMKGKNGAVCGRMGGESGAHRCWGWAGGHSDLLLQKGKVEDGEGLPFESWFVTERGRWPNQEAEPSQLQLSGGGRVNRDSGGHTESSKGCVCVCARGCAGWQWDPLGCII